MLTGKPVWDRKKDWTTKEFLRKIGYEFKIPEIPSEISTEAKEFLNSCFVRNDWARLSADMLLKLPFVKSIGDDEEEQEEEEEDCNIESNDCNIESCSDNFYSRSSSKISKSPDVTEDVRSNGPSNIAYYIDSEEEEDEPIEDYEEEEEGEPTEDYEEDEPIEDYGEEERIEDEEEEEPAENYEEEDEPIEDYEEEEPIEEEDELIEDYEEEEEPTEDYEEEEEPIEDYDRIHSFSRVMMTANEDQNADAKDLEIPDHKRRRMDD